MIVGEAYLYIYVSSIMNCTNISDNDTDSCNTNSATIKLIAFTFALIALIVFCACNYLCYKADYNKPVKIFYDDIKTEEQPIMNAATPSYSITYGSNNVTEDTPNASSINDDAPIVEVHNAYEDKTQTENDINPANESSTMLKNIQSSVTNDSYLQYT